MFLHRSACRICEPNKIPFRSRLLLQQLKEEIFFKTIDPGNSKQ
jgi:hypothetical protein